MPSSPEFVANVLDLMSGWGGVSARRMFSGHGLFRHGRMFGLIVRDVLYFKIDVRTRPEYEAAGMKPFTYRGRRKQVALPYWEAPPHLFDDPEEMVTWARRAFEVALAAKRPAKRSR